MTWCLFNLFHAKSVWKIHTNFTECHTRFYVKLTWSSFHLNFTRIAVDKVCVMIQNSPFRFPFCFPISFFSNTHIIKQIIINIASWYYKYPLNPITAREENVLSQTTVLSITTLPNRVIIHIKSGREWMQITPGAVCRVLCFPYPTIPLL